MKRIALSAAILLSATLPVAAHAVPATGTSQQSHCQRVITQHPDGTVVTQEECVYYPNGTV
jgi:hypothetical protein